MDQPGKVANPGRGQLNKEDEYFPVSVRAWECGLARQVRPSRPAPTRLLSTLRLEMVLTRGIPTAFRDGVHSFIPPTAIGPVSSLNWLRKWVPMEFTVESPPAQGQ